MSFFRHGRGHLLPSYGKQLRQLVERVSTPYPRFFARPMVFLRNEREELHELLRLLHRRKHHHVCGRPVPLLRFRPLPGASPDDASGLAPGEWHGRLARPFPGPSRSVRHVSCRTADQSARHFKYISDAILWRWPVTVLSCTRGLIRPTQKDALRIRIQEARWSAMSSARTSGFRGF